VPSGSANLLFSAGFEGTTALLPPIASTGPAPGRASSASTASRIRLAAHYLGRWPTHFQMIAMTPIDATTLGNYQVNQIQTVTGHNGTPTQALYSEIKQSGCTGTNPMEAAWTRMLHAPAARRNERPLHQLLDQVPAGSGAKNEPPSPNWRVLFEWKTGFNGDDGDYRVNVELVTWAWRSASWYIVGDNVASSGSYARQIYWNNIRRLPLRPWRLDEIRGLWHRSSGADGRVWMAVNGQVIVDHRGSNMGSTTSINRIFMPNLTAALLPYLPVDR